MLAVMTLRQGRSAGKIAKKFQDLFGMTRNTVARWIVWYREVFPCSATWRRIRGLVNPEIGNSNLPADFVSHTIAHCPSPEEGLITCLRLLCLS
jgi:hypothetical protein